MIKQLDGRDIKSTKLQPINLSMPGLKELGTKWMVEMAEYFSENPQIIVNGFVKAGIAGALGGHIDCRHGEVNKSDSDEYESEACDDCSEIKTDLTGGDC